MISGFDDSDQALNHEFPSLLERDYGIKGRLLYLSTYCLLELWTKKCDIIASNKGLNKWIIPEVKGVSTSEQRMRHSAVSTSLGRIAGT